MQYYIVEETKIAKLVMEVMALIEDGFEPEGGMVPFNNGKEIVYYQTMYKGVEEL